MSEQHILVIEAEEQRATRIVAVAQGAQHAAIAVPNCAEAAEALLLQQFDAVLLGSGQAVSEIGELAGYVRGEANGTLLLSYTGENAGVADAVLPPGFDAAQLDYALRNATSPASQAQIPEPAVFDPEKFAEQCAQDTSLMVEIIGLFETEQEEQMAAMTEALAAGDFDRLSKVAHTLKGSVGALHALAARQSCQAIELAAKNGDRAQCELCLGRLQQNLADLAGPLSRCKLACVES